MREDENAWVVGDLAERRSLALVVRWRLHTAADGVDANGAAPCAEDAGRVAAAQDAPGRNAQGVGATWGNESWILRGGLARPDANPITLWIAIEEKAHKDVRAVVRVRSELRLKAFTFYRAKCHRRYLRAVFAGGWLTLRHLDVLLEVHREGWCRERDTGHAGASDYCRDDGAPPLARFDARREERTHGFHSTSMTGATPMPSSIAWT